MIIESYTDQYKICSVDALRRNCVTPTTRKVLAQITGGTGESKCKRKQPEEIERLKAMAQEEHKTVSRFILDDSRFILDDIK